MNTGTYPLAAAMVNQLNRVDNISNNLANANTTGFKQNNLAEGSFNNYLKKMETQDKTPDKLSTVINTVPKIDSSFFDGNLGSITPTGNTLDFALSDPSMFFKVKGKFGETKLTRDGTFHLVDNKLVNKAGEEVLDTNDNPIVAGDENIAFQVGVVKTDYSNLDRKGDNDYTIKNKNSVIDVENKDDYLLQGSLEKSNINMVESMVSLIEAQRKFEQTQKAVNTIDEINSKLIEKVGDTR